MRLFIQHLNDNPKSIAGQDTYVYVVDDEGKKTDISNMVRKADVRLHLGEVVTANLDVFVTSFESRAHLENLIVKEIKRRRWWSRKWRDVTTFGSRTGARWFA